MVEKPNTSFQLLDKLAKISIALNNFQTELHRTLEQQSEYQEQKDLFLNIFQKAKDGIVIIREGKILLTNPKVCEMIGAPPEEIIGSDPMKHFRPDLDFKAIPSYEEWKASKKPTQAGRGTLLKKDGGEVDIEFYAARVEYEGVESAFVVLYDATYIKKAEEELSVLYQYEVSLIEHANLWVDVLDNNGNVVLWNKAAEEISGYSKKEVLGHSKIWDYLYPDKRYRDEIFSRALKIIQQEESVEGFETTIQTRDGHQKFISWFSRNLIDNLGQTIGSIAFGINVTELHETTEALKHTHEDLTLAYDETIEGWSRALDLRDKETEGHSQRVTDLTLHLARLAGMSDNDLVDVRRGALLHDIGKMGVPDSILQKSDKLSDDEWKQMQKHTDYAYQLLSPISYLHSAMDIPYCHHEKWNGTGYPRGLKGEQIPLAARLFAVVDTWDALCSDRPYRKAWAKKEAFEYIKSLSGTHLDPQAVKYFLSIEYIEKEINNK